MAASDDYLIDLLVDMGFISRDQVNEVQPKADETGEGVVDLLVTEKALTRGQIAQAKAAHFNAEFVNLAEMRIADEVLTAVPRNVAKKYNTVPVFSTEDSVSVALADPSDMDTIDALQHLLNRNVTVLVASPDDIETAVNRYYGRADDSVSKMIQDITEGEVEIRPLGQLFALDAQPRQLRGIHAQLLLLDGAQINLADAVARLRQGERALVIGHGALEQLVALRERLAGGKRVFHVAQGAQGHPGVLGHGFFLFEGANLHLRLQRAALVNGSNQFRAGPGGGILKIIF